MAASFDKAGSVLQDLVTALSQAASGKRNWQGAAQSRFGLDGTEPFRWPARWLAIPPELASWAAGKRRVIADIDEFHEQHPEAGSMRSNVVAQEYARRGITSFLVAPRIEGGRVTATLTLGRRRNGKYPPFDAYDQDRLDASRLELALRQIGEAYERRMAPLIQEIVELFTPSADRLDLTETAVQKLGEGYVIGVCGSVQGEPGVRTFRGAGRIRP